MFPEYVNKKLLCLIIFIVLGQVRQENLLARQVICMSRSWLFHTPGMVNRYNLESRFQDTKVAEVGE